MKVLKRNQLIILVVALMLVTAGYFHFTSMYNENTPVSSSLDLANSR